jgi:hypothetical protein
MIRKFTIALVVMAALVITVGSTLAASAHYVRGPDVIYSATTNTITVSGKAAGLGNGAASAAATLSGSVNIFSRCYTKSGNTPQAANKQETIPVDATRDFDIRNGQVTFSFDITPVSTLTCPGKQYVHVESLSYDLTLTWVGFPSLDWDSGLVNLI